MNGDKKNPLQYAHRIVVKLIKQGHWHCAGPRAISPPPSLVWGDQVNEFRAEWRHLEVSRYLFRLGHFIFPQPAENVSLIYLVYRKRGKRNQVLAHRAILKWSSEHITEPSYTLENPKNLSEITEWAAAVLLLEGVREMQGAENVLKKLRTELGLPSEQPVAYPATNHGPI
jgi:hypothetical protein